VRWDEWRGSMDGRPTLWLRRMFRWRGRRIDLHKMIAADDSDCFHTHPAYAVRVVLRGGYVEEVHGGGFRVWRPGMVGLVTPEFCHRIHALSNGRESFSLWIRFRVCAPVFLRGNGWKTQEQTHRVKSTVLQ
jgi:hypothetical protein